MNTYYTALIIFIVTYIGIIFTRLPKMNIDRPSAAFFGAVAMILTGVVDFQEAIHAIDFNTIVLLLGMMIVIATLQLDGFFSLIASKTISYAGTRFRLLVIITLITGLASAFLVNDAVVLLFTPVIIILCKSADLNPVPYLIAEILASNAGSAMTITGNPQNMLIGINSGIGYSEFLIRLLPVSLLSMMVIVVVIRGLYAREFADRGRLHFQSNGFEYNYSSMRWSVTVFLGVVAGFFLHHRLNLSIPLIALAGAALILIFGKIKPSKVIRQVDWVLLLFFASLFIVVHAVEKVGILNPFLENNVLKETSAGLGFVHLSSAVMSQIVSNVPFTIIMLPLMKAANSDILWLSLASASTLAGNATILGAMANLIVIESAEADGIKIGFMEFLKPGLVVTLITLLISFAVLYLQMAW
ncbi:MAG: anion transporter [Bacteroidales bacterium]|nr:anion transporter [Bacteroidales bacterium]NPV35348.1 anion transporter [Bacteroidales bacterium]